MDSLEVQLSNFESVLEDGLVKACNTAGFFKELVSSPDIDGKWEEFIKDYVADATSNFNEYPDAALGFAAYLGMAVTCHWDRNWEAHRLDSYSSYYGSRGFDDMDDHIADDVLHLSKTEAQRVKDCILNCCAATLALIRHQALEPQTPEGFFALVRCYSVMFRIGVAMEMERLGYKKQFIAQEQHG